MSETAVAFSVGDKVQFMRMTCRGSSISLATRYGKVEAVCGNKVNVKMRNGKTGWIHRSDLRLQQQKSQVHDVFQALVEGTKENSKKEAANG